MMWMVVKPVVDLSVRFMCLQKYTNHPKGCPNYEQKDGCPPYAPTIYELINPQLPVWVIWNVFDFAGHCERMKEKHPHWSKRQIACCLYWQPKARKELRETIKQFEIRQPQKHHIVMNPEGAGVNVTATMKSIGIKLQWPPVNKTYQVVLAGIAVKESEVT